MYRFELPIMCVCVCVWVKSFLNPNNHEWKPLQCLTLTSFVLSWNFTACQLRNEKQSGWRRKKKWKVCISRWTWCLAAPANLQPTVEILIKFYNCNRRHCRRFSLNSIRIKWLEITSFGASLSLASSSSSSSSASSICTFGSSFHSVAWNLFIHFATAKVNWEPRFTAWHHFCFILPLALNAAATIYTHSRAPTAHRLWRLKCANRRRRECEKQKRIICN